jgi:hypothetical protein
MNDDPRSEIKGGTFSAPGGELIRYLSVDSLVSTVDVNYEGSRGEAYGS